MSGAALMFLAFHFTIKRHHFICEIHFLFLLWFSAGAPERDPLLGSSLMIIELLSSHQLWDPFFSFLLVIINVILLLVSSSLVDAQKTPCSNECAVAKYNKPKTFHASRDPFRIVLVSGSGVLMKRALLDLFFSKA